MADTLRKNYQVMVDSDPMCKKVFPEIILVVNKRGQTLKEKLTSAKLPGRISGRDLRTGIVQGGGGAGGGGAAEAGGQQGGGGRSGQPGFRKCTMRSGRREYRMCIQSKGNMSRLANENIKEVKMDPLGPSDSDLS